jgi:glycosyltransferase involved in cell wall biosynthesis
VIVEAAANGVPAVANRIGGIPEALGDGGLLVDWDRSRPLDVCELAARYFSAIQRLQDDPGLYRRCSAAARTRAEQYERRQGPSTEAFARRCLDVVTTDTRSA